MTTIACARHGESEFDSQGLANSVTDSPLTALGRNQAEQLGLRLRTSGRVVPTIIACSDMIRATQTAQIVARAFSLPNRNAIIPDPRLREVNFGTLEGQSRDAFKRAGIPLLWQEPGLRYDLSPYGGESRHNVVTRQKACLKDLVKRLPDDRETTAHILVIGHLCSLISLLQEFRQPFLMGYGKFQVVNLPSF